MTDANSDDAILNFIRNKVSQYTEIRSFLMFCNDFNSAHPDPHAPGRKIQDIIRKALRHIHHENYDDTTLAKMMFCLAQPLVDVHLRKVKERLDKSGILRLDKHSIITYYKNDEVELQGEHQPDERIRRESQKLERERSANLEIKFERQMEEESRKLGEREKAREEARAEEERIRMDLYNASPEDWVFDDPNVPSTSDQGRKPRFVGVQAEEGEESAPVAKRVSVETSGIEAQENLQSALPETTRPTIHKADSTASFLPIRASPATNTLHSASNENWGFEDPNIPSTSDHGRPGLVEVRANEEEEVRDPSAERSRFEVSDGNWSILPEPSRPQIHESNSTVLSITSSSAPTVLRNQEAVYYYYELMQSIHNCIYVLEDPTLEPLRADVVEELVKPESIPKMISEKIISEALDEGIKIAVKSAKSDNIKQSMGLVGFLRLLKLQLLNIGLKKDNESVSKITEIIHGSSQEMMIPMAKVRFAMETIFEKIRQ